MSTSPIRLVKLDPLMERSSGSSEITIGLIDGPVAIDHPDLVGGQIRVAGTASAACSLSGSIACQHGTLVAGVLMAQLARRPGNLSWLHAVRPSHLSGEQIGEWRYAHCHAAGTGCGDQETVAAGARVINLSAALLNPDSAGVRQLQVALDFAAARNVITVAAAGNQASIGSSVYASSMGDPGGIRYQAS